MFAVVETGAKQYMVKVGTVIKAEKLEVNQGESGAFGRVLMFGDTNTSFSGLEACNAAGVAVSYEVLGHGRDDKVIIFKKKRRHNYKRKKGHRQSVTFLRVVDISVGKR